MSVRRVPKSAFDLSDNVNAMAFIRIILRGPPNIFPKTEADGYDGVSEDSRKSFGEKEKANLKKRWGDKWRMT